MTQNLPGKIAENSSAGTKKVSATGHAAPGKVASLSSGSDTVALTSSAKLLERLEKTLASLPDIDRSRVEAVKSAIEHGEYQIDADKIAEAMLRTDRQFGE
ncbi:MAG: flagellar biosynthesis anti-sigma factor FlgM [Woeseia sp.]